MIIYDQFQNLHRRVQITTIFLPFLQITMFRIYSDIICTCPIAHCHCTHFSRKKHCLNITSTEKKNMYMVVISLWVLAYLFFYSSHVSPSGTCGCCGSLNLSRPVGRVRATGDTNVHLPGMTASKGEEKRKKVKVSFRCSTYDMRDRETEIAEKIQTQCFYNNYSHVTHILCCQLVCILS